MYFTARQPKLTKPRSRGQLIWVFSTEICYPWVQGSQRHLQACQLYRNKQKTQADDNISDNPTMIPDRSHYKPTENLWTWQRADGMKRSTSPAWLGPHEYLSRPEPNYKNRHVTTAAHL